MELVLHYPDSPAMLEDLSKKLAAVQANYIINRITAMDYTAQQKTILLNRIIQAVRDMA